MSGSPNVQEGPSSSGSMGIQSPTGSPGPLMHRREVANNPNYGGGDGNPNTLAADHEESAREAEAEGVSPGTSPRKSAKKTSKKKRKEMKVPKSLPMPKRAGQYGPEALEGVPAMFIDKAYELWLRNAPRLYEFCTTHVLPTPTNCVSFMADSRRQPPGRDYSCQQVITGTNAPDVNFLTIYNVFVPAEVDELETLTSEELQAFHGVSGRWSDVGHIMQRYQRIVHDGPPTKIAPMPQEEHHQILATKGHGPHTYLFDTGRRRAEPEEFVFTPDMRLKGPKAGGYGLQWSPAHPGVLATTSNDHRAYIYDVSSDVDLLGTRGCTEIGPVLELSGHKDEVEGVTWHHSQTDILCTCSADKSIIMWDYRVDEPMQKEEVHRDAVHAVEFHPTANFMLATASSDRTCRVWDIRSFRKPLMELVGHTDAVTNIKWAPFNDTVMLTTSLDRSVICWDLGKHDCKSDRGDENAAPELVFQHLGHTAPVRDADWSPFAEDEWLVASVCDNNVCMVWSPHEGVYNDEMDVEQYNMEVI